MQAQDAQVKTAQALELLGNPNKKTLWKHAKRLGIATDRGWYWLSEVEAIQQSMATQGQSMDSVANPEEEGQFYRDETAEAANDAMTGFIAPYQPMIEEVSDAIAPAIFHQVHLAIARKVFKMASQSYTPPLAQAASRQLASVRQSGLLLMAASDAPVHAIAPH